MSNAIFCYDLTFSREKNPSREALISFFNTHCKKWVYQLERGDTTGYEHWQARVSLNNKVRNTGVYKLLQGCTLAIALDAISPTASCNTSGDNFYSYCTKDYTRIEGPWSEKDIAQYIPRQYRGLEDKLYPWQEDVKSLCQGWDTRKINIIVDHDGNNGKSTIAHHLRLTMKGVCLPICNDGEKIIQSCCNILMGKKIRQSVPIFIDLPRAMDKTRLYGIYTAIEQIKSGWVYDVRNTWKEWDFDSPHIWVTTNAAPDLEMLTIDRWNIWAITPEKKLKEIKYNDCVL